MRKVEDIPLQSPVAHVDDITHHPEISDKQAYKSKLKHWQRTLSHTQQTYFHQKRRAVIVMEGWDAAGKGGVIRRMTERLDPRSVHVYPIGKPTPDEQSRHYLYRFYTRLPVAGNWTVFDRSYYGRVLVERIEALASEQQWQRAYREINEFERQLTDDGVRIIKLFLHITPDEQTRRFSERLHNAHKRWKLTEEDLRNRELRSHYLRAINDMFTHTDTRQCPWHIVAADHKWYARLTVLEIIAGRLSEGVSVSPPPVDEALAKKAESLLGIPQPKPLA